MNKAVRRRWRMQVLSASHHVRDGFVEGLSLGWALLSRPPRAALQVVGKFLRHTPTLRD